MCKHEMVFELHQQECFIVVSDKSSNVLIIQSIEMDLAICMYQSILSLV